MTEHILSIFREYDLTSAEVKKHVIFVSDRGPDIKYGLINNGFKRLTCFAHFIHNLVSKMLTEANVKKIVDNCARVASFIKNTGLNKHLKSSLKRFTPTRWNSVYKMIDSIIENYGEIYKVLTARQRLRNEGRINSQKNPDEEILNLITALKKSELVSIKSFLEPFKVK